MKHINFCLVGAGYVGCTLLTGIERLKRGEMDYAGVPLGAAVDGYTAESFSCKLVFDVDTRKIGNPVHSFLSLYPELTGKPAPSVTVQQGVELGSLTDMPVPSHGLERDISLLAAFEHIRDALIEQNIDIIVLVTPTEPIQTYASLDELRSFITTGKTERLSATVFYALAALDAAQKRGRGICVINGIPSEIANSSIFISLAEQTHSLIIGDDISSGQSRLLSDLMEHFKEMNRTVVSVIGANWGGNMDFLRLEDPARNASKKKTKTGCASDVLGYNPPSDVRPHGYLEPLGDRKAVMIHIPYVSFGGVVDELFIVGRNTDSPAAAGMLVDMIRLGKLALDRNCSGAVPAINGFYCKRFGKQKSKIAQFAALQSWLQRETYAVSPPLKI